MAVNFEFSNAKVYFGSNYTGTSGTYYKAKTWHTAVTDVVSVSKITDVYIALDDGVTYPTRNAEATALAVLNPGEYNTLTSAGASVNPSSVGTTVSGIKCLLCTSGAQLLFNGNSYPAVQYTTTIDTEYLTFDGVGLSADNCDVYYGSLSNKATSSGYKHTFDTPDGGGACKVWFCKKGTTTPYTNFSYISDLDSNDYEQASDGSITLTLDGEDDTSINLFGSGTTPTSKVNVELEFYNLTIDDIEVGSWSDLYIGYHFDTTTEVKKKYEGSELSITYELGAYESLYVTLYKEDGTVWDTSGVTVEVGSSDCSWQVSSNVMVCTLSTTGNSYGRFEGALVEPSGIASTLTISAMTDSNDKEFVNTYSGAVLTYSPVSGYTYQTGDDFDITVTISNGWKFDTTAACSFWQRGSGNPSSSEVTFVDEHTAKGTISGKLTDPLVWFAGMVGLADEQPEPDYATFITPYIVTKQNVNAIASAIWINEDGSTITATDNILSYKEIYDTLDSDVSQEIKLGGYKTGSTAKYLVDYTHTRNLGGVIINEYWNNADDYENTTIRVYVPLVGIVDVDTKDVMGHKLYLEYRYEIIDGKALAVLYTDSFEPSSIIYQGSCNFAIDEPINSNNIDSYANSYWSVLSAQLGDLQPYVLIDRKQPASGLAEEVGNKVQIAKKVKECSGYVEFEQITVSGLEATNSEYAEIVGLLNSGVIV